MNRTDALESLKSVLCDNDGKCCIEGSDADRQAVNNALAALASDTGERGEVVAWRWPGGHWQDGGPSNRERDELSRAGKEPEYAYSAALRAQPAGGGMLDGGLFAWLVERDLLPEPDESGCVDMVAIVRALSEHERNIMAAPPESGGQGEGMLPDALVPHATEWYRLCERRFSATHITISGELAEAIVVALAQGGGNER